MKVLALERFETTRKIRDRHRRRLAGKTAEEIALEKLHLSAQTTVNCVVLDAR